MHELLDRWSQIFQEMIRAADTDGSGVVEFNEFMDMMAENVEVRCIF